ncbi:hypothetical protein NL108_013375 [Boleophthalmus pectinirostris]|uniref:egl nine homolog 3 n=1 Tax=Boleophthalmus pectinirostris TaxID=150288 RepID=UPI000A1C4B78|nr:egl nine homolog 3 [Boleophthalmus pectinirostris]KAJ0063205.1 hypothetical protein NL108_013375 [Boleophthalmus pectinirostris]
MPLAEPVGDMDIERIVVQRVVPALSAQGFCWLDGVLGEVTGGTVLEQVRRMHLSGALKGGQLMRAAPGVKRSSVRGDRITWVCGTERGCDAINTLLVVIDKLVTSAARKLNRPISHRSKAMVACYPGGGAGYVKHVDNPNSDGRCLTCIYYLNKDWNATEHGGLLRIYPEDRPYVCDIEPLFDRLLLFWSDRRNPHEVRPSYATRYAITVWYFDSEERAEAKRRCRERSDSENSNLSE